MMMDAAETNPAAASHIAATLDPAFVPAALWCEAYRACCRSTQDAEPLTIALSRPDGTVYIKETQVLPHTGADKDVNLRYVERLVKAMLWNLGGSRIHLCGDAVIGDAVKTAYTTNGARAFDADIMGNRIYLDPLTVTVCDRQSLPAANESKLSLGRHLEGCRIGFDLGGSDRKAAAVIDGEVVFSEEVPWDPYFQTDIAYHYDGIQASLKRAAAHLPRVDAIGGSAAGVYVDNEVRVASLFRGLSAADFKTHARGLFPRIRDAWGGLPFEVVNDGEVTALAGSMSLRDHGVLGVAMGTSEAAGYCNLDGVITTRLNELAFSPVDFRVEGPVDEWSGDHGCGVQYFSQQAVGRLMPVAGIETPADMPLPERLAHVQERMTAGDERAARIFETLGVYLGCTLPWYAEFYDFRHLLLLGRVTSGEGGSILLRRAETVLADAFPDLAETVRLSMPDEKLKRHGQAIAAASLPPLK